MDDTATDRHPALLIVFCVLVFAISVLAIAQLTHVWRGIAGGIVMASLTFVAIRFARSRRQAMARGLLSLGVTAFVAPASGLAAAQNDYFYEMLRGQGGADIALIADYEATLLSGLVMLGLGSVAALVLIVIGWRLHRMPENPPE